MRNTSSEKTDQYRVFFFKICLFLCSEDPVFVIIAWFLLLMLFSLWCHQLFFLKQSDTVLKIR